MSKENPNYKHVIAWLNNLPKGRIFTKEDITKELKSENLSEKYIHQTLSILSSKEFYIGKNFNEIQKRRIDSFFKIKNIPTDKTFEDIKWFLRTGI